MRRSGMLPYFAAAVIAVVAAAALTNWALPRLRSDVSGGPGIGSTVDLDPPEPLIDPDQYLIDTEDLVLNPFEADDGLSYTGVGGSP